MDDDLHPDEMEDLEDDDPIHHIIQDLFGEDDFTNRHGGVEAVLASGVQPTEAAVLEASLHCDVYGLTTLLKAGGDPNARRHTACLDDKTTKWDEAAFEENQKVVQDWREWYAIQFVALSPFEVGHLSGGIGSSGREQIRRRRRQAMTILLDAGASVHHTYKAALWPTLPYPFPAEGHDPMYGQTEKDHTLQQTTGESLVEDFDYHFCEVPRPYAGYIERCIIHSIFEDGGLVECFFSKTFKFDTEHRCPLGRTILQAACRSFIGPDSEITMTIDELSGTGVEHGAGSLPDDPDGSIFHRIRLSGADMLATDHSGRNILHHLLEARTSDSPDHDCGVPLIMNSLRWICKNLPELVDRPNKYGTHPLHSALQRLRHFTRNRVEGREAILDDFEAAVNELLDAGANPLAKDGRGNTALHYLAESGLTEVWNSDGVRKLAARFCAAGVDVNARNDYGRTAIEGIFAIDEQLHDAHTRNDQVTSRSQAEIDEEVFALLGSHGADWTARSNDAQTLLHINSKNTVAHCQSRETYLLNKGVDPSLVDEYGKTAQDYLTIKRELEIDRLRMKIKELDQDWLRDRFPYRAQLESMREEIRLFEIAKEEQTVE